MLAETKTMTPEHHPAALALWQSTEGVGVNDRDDAASIAAFLARNPVASQVALQSGQLVGTVLAGSDGRRGYLHHLAVAPECRGQGIGHSLVQAALQVLSGSGIHRSHIMVFKENQAGQHWWHNQGWQRRDELTLMSWVGDA